MSSHDRASTKENENDDVEGRHIENENASEFPSNDGVGAKVVTNHSSLKLLGTRLRHRITSIPRSAPLVRD